MRGASPVGAAAVALVALSSCARLEAWGTADDLARIVEARGARLRPRACAAVDRSRVVECRADLEAAEVETLRTALELQPYDPERGPGPAFGRSRCFDGAPAGAQRWITTLPWLGKSHYRYLLIVVPASGGAACVETEHGYG